MRALLGPAVSSAREVDDLEFAQRVAECQRRVFQIAYGVLRNPADAEEVAQDTFVRAHREFAALRAKEKFLPWVSRIAFRLALNYQRARHRQLVRDRVWHDAKAEGPDNVRQMHNRLFLRRLQDEIDKLPEKLKTVLLLSAVEGVETAELAAMLGVPAGTVRSRLHLARKQLMRAL